MTSNENGDRKEIIVDGGTGTQVTIRKVPAAASASLISQMASAGKNLPASALAPYMVPQRPGDPLGLGIAPGERPPAPPDPDKYDVEVENAQYSRSLLSEKKRRAVDESIKRDGYMTIEKVREIVLENTTKESIEIAGLDPEIISLVDARINYKIFVAGDNIYTRDELYAHFPFHEFGVQPEAIFVQQELGIFPQRKYAMEDGFEYLARDVGDESVEFVMLEDLVGAAARKGYVQKRAPLRIVKTKVFVGKERWDDFALLQRVFRGAIRVSTAQIAYNGGERGGMPPLLAMLTGSAPAPLRIADQATVDAERLQREADAKAEAEKREADLKRREEEARRREEEARRREKEVQDKIEADLRRVEEMLTAATKMNAAAKQRRAAAAAAAAAATAAAAPTATAAATAPTTPATPATPAAEDDDSVAL